MEATADTPRLAPKPLTMLVENGASGHHFDELHSDPKDKQLNCKALERPHKILTAGRHVLLRTATGTTSGKIIDTDGSKHPVEHAGVVALGRHNYFSTLLLLLPKREDKACERVLCGHSLNIKAYRIYRNKTARVTESRNVISIETPASTLADSTESNTIGDTVSTHEDSSPAERRHLYHVQRRDKQPPEETVGAHE